MSVKNAVLGLIAATALVSVGSAAQAGSVTFSSNAVPISDTDFDSSMTFQQFNTAQYGQLLSVMLTLTGEVQGSAGAENLSRSATSNPTLNLAATLNLKRPDGSSLIVVLPAIASTVNLGKYDGRLDYAGASGATLDNLDATLSNSQTYTDAATLALFTGTGTLTAPLSVTGASMASGSGNVSTFFMSAAGGSATVTYTFADAVVPEPASWAMMVAGFGLMGATMRRKKTTNQFA